MAEPFIGQIIQTGFNFAPRGYASCDGQLLDISQNTALFSLLGTTYGGNGTTTFRLPDLRGRAAMNQGQGPGLRNMTMGESIGEENHTLTTSEMPIHSHSIYASSIAGTSQSPSGNYFATDTSGATPYTDSLPNTNMNPTMLSTSGSNNPHYNMQPYLVINFCIALEGIYPSRN
ncbi:MAG: phage tail protein [Candidatus Kapabacteria bacterium]|nr:phage tail protein [Candidatus Kapabacteria bacterium]MBX7155597.1 tail fiber protein [Bacteroidota bacterium]